MNECSVDKAGARLRLLHMLGQVQLSWSLEAARAPIDYLRRYEIAALHIHSAFVEFSTNKATTETDRLNVCHQCLWEAADAWEEAVEQAKERA
jgi:hypothetical protein